MVKTLAMNIIVDFYLGWIVTYIIDERGGGPNSGYISTGFFGGMHKDRQAVHKHKALLLSRYNIGTHALALCVAGHS